MAIIKKCIICNKEFKRRGKRAEASKTCSRDCYHKSRRDRVVKICNYCYKSFEKRSSEIRRNKSGKHFCSRECAFKIMIPFTAFKKGQLSGEKHYFWGKKRPEMTRENSPQWKGGITPISFKIRASFEYEEWRKSVFARDNYTCIQCNEV